MKPAPPLVPPEHFAATPADADETARAPQQMRQILHAMGLYLDSLQARATIMQQPVLSYLQDSVLILGNLLNQLNAAPATAARLPADLPSPGLLGMKCLVVCDNPQAMQLTLDLLQSWGCEIQGAAPTEAALALLGSANHYEVVLCDLYQQDRCFTSSLLEQVHDLQPKALPIVVEVLPVICSTGPLYPTRLPRPLAPAKLRACLLACRLRF
jgi:hypothetical protein